MYLLVHTDKILKSKWVMALIASCIIFFCIIMNRNINLLRFGKNINLGGDIFENKPYNAEYELTVTSNKNINTYYICEWHDNGKYRYESKDPMGNIITTKYNGNVLKIENSSEKNKLKLDYISKTCNLASYFTYIKLYEYISSNPPCGCNIKTYEKDGKIEAHFYKCMGNNESCDVHNVLNENEIQEVIITISTKTKLPETIILYNKNKEVRMCIVYNKFEYNSAYDAQLFE